MAVKVSIKEDYAGKLVGIDIGGHRISLRVPDAKKLERDIHTALFKLEKDTLEFKKGGRK